MNEPSAFGHMNVIAHWRAGEDGEPVRDGAVASCWPVWNEFHPIVFEAYPEQFRRDGAEIIVTMVNGTARYLVDGASVRDGWIAARLIDVQAVLL